jgi:hypothetical protein
LFGEIYPLALLIALAFAALILAALAWVLALLVGVLTAALLLTRLILVALVLLSALVWIISHYLDSFRKLPGRLPTVRHSTGSN